MRKNCSGPKRRAGSRHSETSSEVGAWHFRPTSASPCPHSHRRVIFWINIKDLNDTFVTSWQIYSGFHHILAGRWVQGRCYAPTGSKWTISSSYSLYYLKYNLNIFEHIVIATAGPWWSTRMKTEFKSDHNFGGKKILRTKKPTKSVLWWAEHFWILFNLIYSVACWNRASVLSSVCFLWSYSKHRVFFSFGRNFSFGCFPWGFKVRWNAGSREMNRQ